MKPLESFVGQPVRSLQTMLRVLGEARGEPTTLIPDGIYGRQTQNAVSRFQRDHGIPVTGVADQNTWDRLVLEYTPAVVQVEAAEPLQIIMNPGKVYRRGDTSYNIYLIQVILLALAEIYGSMAAPALTGILDAQTTEALIAFQYLNDLPQTGEVDKNTWKQLALQYPLAVNHRESKNPTRR